MGDAADELEFWEEGWHLDTCPSCKGRGLVNPLTAPKDFFCVGTTDCPDCEGSGKI